MHINKQCDILKTGQLNCLPKKGTLAQWKKDARRPPDTDNLLNKLMAAEMHRILLKKGTCTHRNEWHQYIKYICAFSHNSLKWLLFRPTLAGFVLKGYLLCARRHITEGIGVAAEACLAGAWRWAGECLGVFREPSHLLLLLSSLMSFLPTDFMLEWHGKTIWSVRITWELSLTLSTGFSIMN